MQMGEGWEQGMLARWAARILTAVIAVAVIPAPVRPVAAAPAAGPLRYVDPIFESVDVTYDIAFATPVGWDGVPVTLAADVYQPAGDTAVDRRVVVLVHGGGFTAGSKSQLQQDGVELARRGYVAVAVDYRLRPPPSMSWCDFAPTGPTCDPALADAISDATTDVGSAVNAIRDASESMRVDPDAIAVLGYSAGAIVGLYLAHATVPGGGGAPAATPPVQAAVSIVGAMAPADVAPGAAPALMVNGTDDTVVPYSAAVSAHAAAVAAGDDARLVTVPGAGHTFDAAQAAVAGANAIAFLDEVLQPQGRDLVYFTFNGAVTGSVSGRLATGDFAARTGWGGVLTALSGAGRVATPSGVADVSASLNSFWILPIYLGSITVSSTATGVVRTPLFFARLAATATSAAGATGWFNAAWRPYTLNWSIRQG